MTTLQAVQTYLLTIPVFFAIDMVWLVLIAKTFYNKQIGHLMSGTVNWPAALLFYFLFIAGIIIFAVLPAVDKGSLGRAALLGAIFGLMTYATYDLTNLATLKNWPVLVTVIDLIWGMTLSTLVASISYLIAQRIS